MVIRILAAVVQQATDQKLRDVKVILLRYIYIYISLYENRYNKFFQLVKMSIVLHVMLIPPFALIVIWVQKLVLLMNAMVINKDYFKSRDYFSLFI